MMAPHVNIPQTPVVQINLGKRMVAQTTLFSSLKTNQIILVQEPSIRKGRITNVPKSHTQFVPFHRERNRAAVLIPRDLARNTMMLGGLCDRDIATVRCRIDKNLTIVLSSIYMDITKQIPINLLGKIAEYAKKESLPLIIGVDTNAHHTVWGSRDINARGRTLLQTLGGEGLAICNKGAKTTFRGSRGSSVIDLTLTNNLGLNLITNWEVDDNSLLSDHQPIRFNLDLGCKLFTMKRNISKCDWDLYRSLVKEELSRKQFRFQPVATVQDLNNRTSFINEVLNKCFDQACPLFRSRIKSSVPWWSAELTKAKQSARKLNRRAYISKQSSDRAAYKDAHNNYKSLIRKAKRNGWKKFCSDIKGTQDFAKINKILKKGNKYSDSSQLNSVKKENGDLTSSPQETLQRLGEVLIPDSGTAENMDDAVHGSNGTEKEIHDILAPHRLDRAVRELHKNKAPGPDKIRNDMLVEAWGDIKFAVRRIFIHSLTLSTSPSAWHEATGVIIPKPLKLDYTEPRAFRIIALTSSLQKLLERVILWHLQIDLKVPARLTKSQHGFKKGASTESAIHHLTRRIEDGMINNQDSIGIFLDIEGAFDNISFRAIKEGLIEAGIPPTIARWIFAITSNRTITLSYSGESITRRATKGSAQGGVLSPLIWNITLDTFLKNLGINKKFVTAFADDLVILVSGICRKTIRDVTQYMINDVEKWCNSKGLKLSSVKTTALLFSSKKDKTINRPIKVGNLPITFSKQVTYLGVIIDDKLSWKAHIDHKVDAGRKQLFNCQRSVGKTWGLTPKCSKWLYNQVQVPSISYGSVVWAHKVCDRKDLINSLNKLQYLAARMISRGLHSSAGVNLEIIAGLTPISIKIKSIALSTAIRLKINNKWDNNYQHPTRMRLSHAFTLDREINKLHSFNSGTIDWIPTETVLDRRFKTIIEDRTQAIIQAELRVTPTVQIFTDGSKKNNMTGAGMCVYICGIENHTEYYHLGTNASVFQSELYAINRAAEWALSHCDDYTGIEILTDSQAGLRALNSSTVQSKLVKETISNLNVLGTHSNTVIKWVPGHMGVTGNERADELARQGSSALPIGPPPFVPIPAGSIKQEINNLHREQHQKLYDKEKISPKGKAWVSNILATNNPSRLTHNTRDTRILTWLYSGHSPLGYFQNKTGNFSSPNCRECPGTEETSDHYIGKCPAYANIRQQIFGACYMEPTEVMEHTPWKLLQYVHKTGRLEGDDLFTDPDGD